MKHTVFCYWAAHSYYLTRFDSLLILLLEKVRTGIKCNQLIQ